MQPRVTRWDQVRRSSHLAGGVDMNSRICLTRPILRGLFILATLGCITLSLAQGAGTLKEDRATALYLSAADIEGTSLVEKWRKQIEIYQQVVAQFPQTERARYARITQAKLMANMVSYLRREGKQEAADELAGEAIEVLRPFFDVAQGRFSVSARHVAARLSEDMGKLDEAVLYYSNILTQFPDAPEWVAQAELRLARIELKRGEYRQFMPRCRRWLSEQPPNPQLVRSAERGMERLFQVSQWWEHEAIWYREVLDGALGPLDEEQRRLYEKRQDDATMRAYKAPPGERVAAYCRLWQSGYLEEMADYHLSSLTGEQYPDDAFLKALQTAAEEGVRLDSFSNPEVVSEDQDYADVRTELTLNQDFPPLLTSGPKILKLARREGVWRIVAIEPAPAGTEASSHCGGCADESAESPGGCCGHSNTSSSEQPTGCGCSSPSSQ